MAKMFVARMAGLPGEYTLKVREEGGERDVISFVSFCHEKTYSHMYM